MNTNMKNNECGERLENLLLLSAGAKHLCPDVCPSAQRSQADAVVLFGATVMFFSPIGAIEVTLFPFLSSPF